MQELFRCLEVGHARQYGREDEGVNRVIRRLGFHQVAHTFQEGKDGQVPIEQLRRWRDGMGLFYDQFQVGRELAVCGIVSRICGVKVGA